MAKTQRTVAWLVGGIACLVAPNLLRAASPLKLTGAIRGVVSDSLGVPQMGATVILYNRQDRASEKVQTDERGEFRFVGLFPDLYSVKVTLATFLPAFRHGIQVRAGMHSILQVNLSGVFSTIQFSYPQLENGNLMTDDWKWVLRSSSTTRPILRFLDTPPDTTSSDRPHVSAFSDTRGILKVSAGEGGFVTGVGNEADLGTAFAVATSFYGNNQLQVAGNVGYGSQTGVPMAAFRAAYSRGATSPEVSLTMRQLFVPGGRLGSALGGNESVVPMVRTMSAGVDHHIELADGVSLQYGMAMDSVVFVDHMNYVSPYARLSYSLGSDSEVDFAYTSGNARPDLARMASAEDSDLQRDLSTLAVFPNVSMIGGRAKVQRGQEYELTYSRKMGSRTFYASVYREAVTNAALSIVAPNGTYANGDILPDLFSGSSVFNAGDYQTNGYTAAVTQNLGDHLSATVVYGSMGALTVDNHEIVSGSPDELRAMIHAGRKHAATARISATAPWTGTRMVASYQFAADGRWAMPGNLYSTQAIRQTPGLNIYVRQPIPMFSALPWRMEATADLRNMLAQGYLGINMMNGQRMLLMETPRSFRGGLSFIF